MRCPASDNIAVADCGRLRAASDPTGLIACGAWGRICFCEESSVWEPDGSAGSATAGALCAIAGASGSAERQKAELGRTFNLLGRSTY